MSDQASDDLKTILDAARPRFTNLAASVQESPDVLMTALGVTPADKASNPQKVGRHLGAVFEDIVRSAVRSTPSLRYAGPLHRPGKGKAELCDLRVVLGTEPVAIEVKYRLGSGDHKTLAGITDAGAQLRTLGYRPLMLLLRPDSLPQALRAVGVTWDLVTGEDTLTWLATHTCWDLSALCAQATAHLTDAA